MLNIIKCFWLLWSGWWWFVSRVVVLSCNSIRLLRCLGMAVLMKARWWCWVVAVVVWVDVEVRSDRFFSVKLFVGMPENQHQIHIKWTGNQSRLFIMGPQKIFLIDITAHVWKFALDLSTTSTISNDDESIRIWYWPHYLILVTLFDVKLIRCLTRLYGHPSIPVVD